MTGPHRASGKLREVNRRLRQPWMVGLLWAATVSLAACSTTPHRVALSSPTTLTGVSSISNQPPTTTTVPPTTTTVVATTTTTTEPSTTTAPPARVPTLGQLAGGFGIDGQGFGQVEPSTVFNGGDPTGRVTNIVWKSWGGTQAVGDGTGWWVGPNQAVAQGTLEPATIVAFNLGTCEGKFMYQAVEWYFPQHGETFDPNQYENICLGTYVPSL